MNCTARRLCFILATVVMAWGFALTDVSAQPTVPPPSQKYIDSLLKGIMNRNIKEFTQYGNADFKAKMTPPNMNQIAEKFARRLRGGYVLNYVGKMRRMDLPVYLYIVKFKDGGDDHLAMLSLHNLEVSGFYFF